ncbi:MAG: GNAT family N-acetyltransferase [Gammaproteobacteria bacterium]
MTTILETERLILRTWRASDLEPMCKINQDPKVMAYFPGLQDRATTKQFIDKVTAHYQKNNYALYATQLKSTHEFIGFIGLDRVNFSAHFTPAIEIGWRLSSKHWNKGYATEGAKAVLHYAFTTLDIPEIISFTVTGNTPSRRVMEKIGLSHNVSDDFAHPKLGDDSPLQQHVLYRLTKAVYLSRNQK